MGKEAKERKQADNEAKAVARNLRVSPQKLNLVAGMIRGRRVEDALLRLTFSNKRISGPVKTALQSAPPPAPQGLYTTPSRAARSLRDA